MDPKAVISSFKEHLNRRNLDGLSSIIGDRLAFIDSSGHTIMGKKACLDAWEEFCRLFPDYQHVFEEIVVNGPAVTIRGHSTCSDKRIQGPALWSARIMDGKVNEWRVYRDTEEKRKELGL